MTHGADLGRRSGMWRPISVGAAALATVAVGAWIARREPPPEARWAAIQAAIEGRRWDVAAEGLRAWVEARPADPTAWIALGAVEDSRGRLAESTDAFRRVPEGSPRRAEARALLAEVELKRDDAAAAEEALRVACAIDPRAAGPRRRLVYLLSLEARTEEARAVLWELYAIDRDPRHLLSLVGQRLVEYDGRDLAPVLERLLKKHPDDPRLRRARGLMRLRLGKPGEAMPDLDAAAVAIDEDPTVRLARAESLLLLGRPEGFDAAIGPKPASKTLESKWRALRARRDEEANRPDAAADGLRLAVEAEPRNHVALYRLGQLLIRQGKAADAKPLLDRAEALRKIEADLSSAVNNGLRGPLDVAAIERLARLCRESGMPREARAWLEQAIRLDPTRPETQAAFAAAPDSPEPPSERPKLRPDARVATADRAVDSADKAPFRLEDVADRAGLKFRYNCGERGDLYIADTMGGGVGLFDYDNDGWIDVYFVDGCKLPVDPRTPARPNRLFRNRRDGTFEDVTEKAGLAGLGYGMGCAVGDYDEDGDDDLFVTGLGRTILYRNRGDGTFEDVTERAGVSSTRWTTAAGFGDLDGDGDLDLYVVTYVAADPNDVPRCADQLGRSIHCPPNKFAAEPDHLFRNNGDGTFTDVAQSAGIDVPNGDGLGLAVADLDGDGRLDLFVANDTYPNFLFRNLGGLKFAEVAMASGVALNGSGRATASMGVAADDLDGDGVIDLFHTDFNNEPNTFLKGLGGGQFQDATASSGLAAPSVTTTGFGVAAGDLDNDGRLDLFVANGHVDDQPWFQIPMAQPPQAFANLGRGRFSLAPASVGPYFARTFVARGAAMGDLDNDGKLDLVVVHRDAPAVLLRNTTPDAGHWLGLQLIGVKSGKTPIGAKVTCRSLGVDQSRWLTGGTGYLSQHDPRLHFGLGRASTVDRLQVTWPSGLKQMFHALIADRDYTLVEGGDPRPR